MFSKDLDSNSKEAISRTFQKRWMRIGAKHIQAHLVELLLGNDCSLIGRAARLQENMGRP